MVYNLFREEDSLVDTFVIEMLVVMVTSLRLAHADNKLQGMYVCMGLRRCMHAHACMYAVLL